MGWETRRNRRFYYRSVHTDQGCRKVYIGNGDAGAQAAAVDEARRAALAAERDRQAANRQHLMTVADVTRLFDDALDTLLHAELLVSGFQKKHRRWRAPT